MLLYEKTVSTCSDFGIGKLMVRLEATERAARHLYSTSLHEGEWSFALLQGSHAPMAMANGGAQVLSYSIVCRQRFPMRQRCTG